MIQDYWLTGLPLPPSVNESVAWFRGRMIKTAVHKKFIREFMANRIFATPAFNAMKKEIYRSINFDGPRGLRVDLYFSIEHSRLYSKAGEPKRLDGDNRVKPVLDVLATALGIDDKHIFAGSWEKTMTLSKGSECTTIRIRPMVPRTHQQVRDQMLQSAKPRETDASP